MNDQSALNASDQQPLILSHSSDSQALLRSSDTYYRNNITPMSLQPPPQTAGPESDTTQNSTRKTGSGLGYHASSRKKAPTTAPLPIHPNDTYVHIKKESEHNIHQNKRYQGVGSENMSGKEPIVVRDFDLSFNQVDDDNIGDPENIRDTNPNMLSERDIDVIKQSQRQQPYQRNSGLTGNGQMIEDWMIDSLNNQSELDTEEVIFGKRRDNGKSKQHGALRNSLKQPRQQSYQQPMLIQENYSNSQYSIILENQILKNQVEDLYLKTYKRKSIALNIIIRINRLIWRGI